MEPAIFRLLAVVFVLGSCFASTPENKFAKNVIEPHLVATFEDILDLPNHLEKLLIDVREPEELRESGEIPTAINIPCKWFFNA
jgi:3-mercaptopyruvate sulfurtransferase SseA